MRIVYDDLVSLEKIKEQYYNIRLNTKNKAKLYKFEIFYSCNIFSILNILRTRNYQHGHYHIFLIKKPKYRIIMSENMVDKIVNHIFSKYVLEPLIYPKLINYNVATRSGLGTSAGINYVKKFINELKFKSDKCYVLKCDIKKYFYNIDHEILLNKLKLIIDDEDIYRVIKNMINSTDLDYVNKNIKAWITFEKGKRLNKNVELDKIPLYEKGKGLPIGNMTSQILAIFYLNEMDCYIKDKLHVKYYVRYMDDFLVFDTNKDNLRNIKKEIEKKLAELKLELNQKTRIYDLNDGFSFLGYFYFLKNKRLIIKLSKNNKKKIMKKYVKNKENVRLTYNGYLKNAKAGNFLYLLEKNYR